MVPYGTVRYGMVRYRMYATVRYRMVRYDTVWYGTVRYGNYGTVRYGMVRCGTNFLRRSIEHTLLLIRLIILNPSSGLIKLQNSFCLILKQQRNFKGAFF